MSTRAASLRLRMVAAILGLSVVTIGLLAGVWIVFYALFAVVESSFAPQIAFIVTAGALLTIGYLEYTHIGTVERLADAHSVDRETAPDLYETTTRVAAQLDVPVPTIAVSERETPEALTVGFRPDSVHLILSLGTIESLESAELEAVIAHELAHVKNRDAMVMTAVSLPIVLADGLRSRIAAIERPGWAVIIIVPLAALSAVIWVVGRTISARLSRAREVAADRAAAEVTGSPAALADALTKLDHHISETPARDLREVSGVSSLSILPLEPAELEKVMLGPEGDIEPAYWELRRRLHRLERWLFRSHPSTEERIAALRDRQREVEAR